MRPWGSIKISPIVAFGLVPRAQAGLNLQRQPDVSPGRELGFKHRESLFRQLRYGGDIMVQSMWKKTKRLLTSEDGPTAVEYAVLLALIAGAVMASVQALATATGSSFNRSAAAIVGS